MRNRAKVTRHNENLQAARASREIDPSWVLIADAVVAAAQNDALVEAVSPAVSSGYFKVRPKAKHSHKAGLGLRDASAKQRKNRADTAVDPMLATGVSPHDDCARFEPRASHVYLTVTKDGDSEPSKGRVPVRADWDWNARSHTRVKPTEEA